MSQFKQYLRESILKEQWMPRRKQDTYVLGGVPPIAGMLNGLGGTESEPEHPEPLDTIRQLRPHTSTINWSDKPEPEDEDIEDIWDLSDPYIFRGITNDYGLLRKKTINFNEIN
tara:strand:- start:92 stop:433 length:342 start_codon:yes stop_codon:yes gene_type:complete